MQIRQTFSTFDFTNTWAMPAGITTTPLLKSLYVPLTNIILKDTTLIKGKRAYILQPVPANATFTDCTWSSSNPDMASVDSNGLITAVNFGEAFIFSTSKQGAHSAYCAATGIIIEPSSSSSLFAGGMLLLSAKVTPDDASNQSINWTTSNPSVATVNDNGYVSGTGRGTVTITATTADGGFSGSWNLEVIQPVTNIILNEDMKKRFNYRQVLWKLY